MPDLNVIDATAELKLLRFLDEYSPPFDVIGTYRLIDDGVRPEATVTLRAGEQEMHEADLGVGPVDALANVLKKSLGQLFPDIAKVRVLDFKVRLIEGHIGTSSQIEVDIVFSDGKSFWRVSSVDDNVNLASFRVLLDGYEYAIYLWSKGSTQNAARSTQKKTATATRKRGTGETAKRGKGKAKAKPEAKATATAKPKAKAKTAAKVKPKAATKAKAESKPKAKPKAAAAKTSAKPKVATKSKTRAAAKPKAMPKKK